MTRIPASSRSSYPMKQRLPAAKRHYPNQWESLIATSPRTNGCSAQTFLWPIAITGQPLTPWTRRASPLVISHTFAPIFKPFVRGEHGRRLQSCRDSKAPGTRWLTTDLEHEESQNANTLLKTTSHHLPL